MTPINILHSVKKVLLKFKAKPFAGESMFISNLNNGRRQLLSSGYVLYAIFKLWRSEHTGLAVSQPTPPATECT
jgi:hypothetical protein